MADDAASLQKALDAAKAEIARLREHLQVAQELARSLGDASAQLKLAVDLGNIAIWRHDLRTDRMYYNDRAFAVLGIAPRAQGLSIAEVRSYIHPDDVPHVLESAQRALATDKPTDMEARYRRSDGSWRYVLTRRVVQRDATGAAQAFVGVALDITEQVEKQREASRLARRLESAAAAAGIGIWSVDVNGVGGEWNAQMYTLTGRDPAARWPTPDEWWNRIVHPEDRDAFHRHEQALLASEGELREFVYRIVRPDGQARWLVDRAVCEQVDGQRMLLGVSLDITAQHRTELALREANERAALAARGAGIGTWHYDVANDAAQWDEQMWRLRGLAPRPGALDPEARLALVHPDDAKAAASAQRRRLEHTGAVDAEFRIRLPDGRWRWIASRSVVVASAESRPLKLLGVNWDVTEAREAAAARQEQALAERESRAKSVFLSRMSHELRTPLNAVLGFAQLLEHESGTPIGTPQLAKLGHIRRAGQHLLALIEDVLDLTRLESGQVELELTGVAIDALIDEALALVAPLAARGEVTLARTGVAAGGVQALGDRKRLLQVLLNLLSNAIKYNNHGGSVTVTTLRTGSRVRVEVADSGRGLDANELAHLFEPFNRLHAEAGSIEGTGIGLVIVKALLERLGGTIAVRSARGAGTTFSFELPEAPAGTAVAPTSSPAPLAQAAAPAALGGRLLYIEDNPVNVTLIEEIVRSLPAIEFTAAVTGAEGVARALALRPALILLDMQLPDIDGPEVLKRLRANEATASIPCIAVSANAMSDDIRQAMALGFTDYWTKPIDVVRFRAAIAERFSR